MGAAVGVIGVIVSLLAIVAPKDEKNGATPPSPTEAPTTRPVTQPLTLPIKARVKYIQEFEQTRGSHEWVSRQRDRVANSEWEFRRDGTFSYTTTDVRTDTYPLRGTFRQDGVTLSFSGTSSSQIGDQYAFVEMSGTINLAESPLVLRYQHSTSMGEGTIAPGEPVGSYSYGSTRAAVVLETE